jgi:predicted glycosyltransferase
LAQLPLSRLPMHVTDYDFDVQPDVLSALNVELPNSLLVARPNWGKHAWNWPARVM